MIGSYATGIFPRPNDLIKVTRAYNRGETDEQKLERAFKKATTKVIEAQLRAGFSYVTDGMLKWQDPLRPFTENLNGIKKGSLNRWFDNNTFYRKPVIMGEIARKKSLTKKTSYVKSLPRNLPWKAILPAPYTLAQLSENQFYPNKTELMFQFAQILREEIEDLTKLGFKYIQLSDPALVYAQLTPAKSKMELDTVKDALVMAISGLPTRTCLQTFFGDFAQILPEALDFPVNDLGIDLYETNFDTLKEFRFEKGIALGLANARSSLVENDEVLAKTAKEIIKSMGRSEAFDVFICPNCDLEFLPWQKAEEKMKFICRVTNRLRDEFNE